MSSVRSSGGPSVLDDAPGRRGDKRRKKKIASQGRRGESGDPGQRVTHQSLGDDGV